MKVSVIIPSWNGRKFLQGCLEALQAQTFRDFRVLLIDNGSEDDTVSFVRKNFPQAEVIALAQNAGFAKPNNLGILRAFRDRQVQYVVTLNNDTKPEPDYLAELVACAERHPEAGSVQPKVINFYEQDVIDSTGILIAREMSAVNRGYKEADVGQFEEEAEIFGPSASAALYTRRAMERVAFPDSGCGPEFFDNNYFAYYEDVDLAWRLRLAGFTSIYAPRARVHHVHSATGKSFSSFKSFHIHRNHYYNILKNLPMPYLAFALGAMPVRYLLLVTSLLRRRGPAAKLAQNLQQGRESLVRIVLRSWREVLVNLPLLWTRRRFIQGRRVVKRREVGRWFRLYGADYRRIFFS